MSSEPVPFHNQYQLCRDYLFRAAKTAPARMWNRCGSSNRLYTRIRTSPRGQVQEVTASLVSRGRLVVARWSMPSTLAHNPELRLCIIVTPAFAPAFPARWVQLNLRSVFATCPGDHGPGCVNTLYDAVAECMRMVEVKYAD